MATEKRPGPGPKLRARFARNRIRRRFIDIEIVELREKLAASDTAKGALKISLEIERLKALRQTLKVRRRTQNGRKKTAGTFGGLF